MALLNLEPHTILQWIVYMILAVLSVKAICTVIYRIYFHPLSNFPGPTFAKLTDLWSVYHGFKGQIHLTAYDLHRQYGSVVRFGPNKLSISSMSSIQQIYYKNNDRVLKSQAYAAMNPTSGVFTTLSCIDPIEHKMKRKVFSQAFSEDALHAFEPMVLRHVDTFVEQIRQQVNSNRVDVDHSSRAWSLPLDMAARTRYYATDVMGDFGFGKSFDLQTTDVNKLVLNVTDAAGFIAGLYVQYPRLQVSAIGKILSWLGSSKRKQFGQLARKLIDERLSEKDENKRDLLNFMTDAARKDSEIAASLTTDDIWAESRFVLIAGAETTATAISATLFYLSRYTAEYNKLTKTLRSTFASQDQIRTGEQLAKCEYLWACIDEAMRLSPSVVSILWREVTGEGVMVDGHPLPVGSDIGTSCYLSQHDERIFPDPFKFIPERWLETASDKEQSTERIKRQRAAHNPFGFGIRKCIGYKMAYNEIALCLAKTLWSLDLRKPEGREGTIGEGREGVVGGRGRREEFQLYGHVTSRHQGPFVEWAHREDHN